MSVESTIPLSFHWILVDLVGWGRPRTGFPVLGLWTNPQYIKGSIIPELQPTGSLNTVQLETLPKNHTSFNPKMPWSPSKSGNSWDEKGLTSQWLEPIWAPLPELINSTSWCSPRHLGNPRRPWRALWCRWWPSWETSQGMAPVLSHEERLMSAKIGSFEYLNVEIWIWRLNIAHVSHKSLLSLCHTPLAKRKPTPLQGTCSCSLRHQQGPRQ